MVEKFVKGYDAPKKVHIINTKRNEFEVREEQKSLKNDEIDWGDDSLEMEEFDRYCKKKKILVEKVLNKYPKATNNDRIMDFECLRAEFPEIDIESDTKFINIRIPKKLIKILPPPESYRRQRQSLNAEFKCLPTNENTKIRRKRQERVIKRYYGKRKDK